jgi:excisionase family DNA binding protein
MNSSQPASELLTVLEVSIMLRLKESTIRSWILKKRIPYVKLGRRVFVRQSDAQNAIETSVVYPDAKATAH